MEAVNKYTILAVDDAKDSLMLLEFDLKEAGYQVITAESGNDALSILINTDVSLILLDMYMPGISGLTALQEIKSQSNLAHIPVIMLSASVSSHSCFLSHDLVYTYQLLAAPVPPRFPPKSKNVPVTKHCFPLQPLSKNPSKGPVQRNARWGNLGDMCRPQFAGHPFDAKVVRARTTKKDLPLFHSGDGEALHAGTAWSCPAQSF